MLMSLAEYLGAPPRGTVSIGLFLLGILGTFLVLTLSMYRWFKGFSRTKWQEEQAALHRKSQANRN